MTERQVIVVVIGAVAMTALIVVSVFIYNRQFVQGGYCKQQQLGRSATLWVKCK